jgi:hypothetical protein
MNANPKGIVHIACGEADCQLRSVTVAVAEVTIAEPMFIPVPSELPTPRHVAIVDRSSGNRIVTAIALARPATSESFARRADHRPPYGPTPFCESRCVLQAVLGGSGTADTKFPLGVDLGEGQSGDESPHSKNPRTPRLRAGRYKAGHDLGG